MAVRVRRSSLFKALQWIVRRAATTARALPALLLVALIAVQAAPSGARAQDAATGSGATHMSYDELQRAMDDAARDGARVIVIDPSANAESASPGPASPSSSFDAYATLASGQDQMVRMTQTTLKDFVRAFREKMAAAPNARAMMDRELGALSPTGDPRHFLYVTLIALGLMMASHLLMSYVLGYFLFKDWFLALTREAPKGLPEKLPVLLIRAIFGLVNVFVSLVVAVAVGTALGLAPDDATTQQTLIILATAYILSYAVAVTWRVVLAPYISRFRIPHFSDRDATRLYHWLWITATLALFFQGYCVWLEALELTGAIYALNASGFTLITAVLNTLMAIVNRRAISKAIRRGRSSEAATWPARWAGRLWLPAIVFYSFAAWAVMTWRLILDQPPGPPLIVSAYVVMVSALAVYGVSAFALYRLIAPGRFRVLPPEAPAEPPVEIVTGRIDGDDDEEGGGARIMPPPPPRRPRAGQMNSFEALAGRVASIFAVAAGVYALLGAWSVKSAPLLGEWTGKLDDIGVILLIGYVAFHALRIWIDQRIEEEGGAEISTEPGEGEGGGAGASRLATLLPLFRNFLLATITISVVLIVALELGVNVAPLFAGAGVVGLAIGFGAQALVRDILSGAFFLVDDAFRKGEYIDLGTVKGTVERISVRSFQLRHHLGYLHTVPFGEIQHLTNYSRDWVIMKLPIRLTYDTDAEKVRKLIKKLGQDLLEDPEHGPQFLQPLKSQGVIQMEDSAMIMRVKFMTRPGDQWVLRKVIFAKIRELFEREGIPFAHREVTVRLANDPGRPLTTAEKEAVAGAAHAASLAAEEAQKGPSPALADER